MTSLLCYTKVSVGKNCSLFGSSFFETNLWFLKSIAILPWLRITVIFAIFSESQLLYNLKGTALKIFSYKKECSKFNITVITSRVCIIWGTPEIILAHLPPVFKANIQHTRIFNSARGEADCVAVIQKLINTSKKTQNTSACWRVSSRCLWKLLSFAMWRRVWQMLTSVSLKYTAHIFSVKRWNKLLRIVYIYLLNHMALYAGKQ